MSKKLIFYCYKALIEKLGEQEFRIYLYQHPALGGDVEIAVKGNIEIRKEQFKETKRGIDVTIGFKKIEF